MGNWTPIAQKLNLWVLRLLNIVHKKFDYIVKFTKVGQPRLLGALAT